MIYKIECLNADNFNKLENIVIVDCVKFKFKDIDHSNRIQVVKYGISKAMGLNDVYIDDKYVGQSAFYKYYKAALVKYLRDKKIDEINGI